MTKTAVGTVEPGCGYCAGRQQLCTCTRDCGMRETDFGYVCCKAPVSVRAAWLRRTNLRAQGEFRRRGGDSDVG